MKKQVLALFLISALAQASPIAYKPEVSSPSIAWIIMIVFLSLLLLPALFLCRKKHWLQKPTTSGKIKLLEKQRLGVNTYAYLIEKEGAEYLMIDNGQHIAMQSLSSQPDKD